MILGHGEEGESEGAGVGEEMQQDVGVEGEGEVSDGEGVREEKVGGGLEEGEREEPTAGSAITKLVSCGICVSYIALFCTASE